MPNRPTYMIAGRENEKSTPWGMADTYTVFGDGVIFYTTPSHGGFHLSEERLAELPECIRKRGTFVKRQNANTIGGNQWFEEDCDAALIILGLPDLFDASERDRARSIADSWFPGLIAELADERRGAA